MKSRLAVGPAGFVVGMMGLLGSVIPVQDARAQRVILDSQVVLNFSQGPVRDRVPPPRVGTGVLKGRVVDGVSGAAVARARVRLQGGGGPRSSVLTDAAGGFAFPGLPSGQYSLMVDKATYLASQYPERGRMMRSTSKPLMLEDSQTLDRVTVPLFRGGAITGHVVDANGDPVEWAQVSVLKVPASGRSTRPMMRGGNQTNDLGEFRVSRLEAGTYLLMVAPQRMGPEEPMIDGQPPQPQVQPAPTYYPNAPAIDLAQPIVVQRGQTISSVDVTLGETVMSVVTGVVSDMNGQPMSGNGFVSARSVFKDFRGGGNQSGSGIRPDGAFRLQLPPGDYVLEARMSPPSSGGPPSPGIEQFGVEAITVGAGSVDAVSILMGHGATATGRVVFDGTSALPQSPGQVHVPLYSPDGPGCRSSQATVAADWTFRVEGLSGTCSNQPSTMTFGPWMLKAILLEGEDILDRPFTFQPGRQLRNVQIVFTDKRSAVTLRVADEAGQTTREYVALLFPTDKARWTQSSSAIRPYVPPPPATTMGRSVSPGVSTGATAAPMIAPLRPETVTNLRPGEYYAIAVDNMELEEFREPGTLELLAKSATRVMLGDGANVEVPLRRFRLADLAR